MRKRLKSAEKMMFEVLFENCMLSRIMPIAITAKMQARREIYEFLRKKYGVSGHKNTANAYIILRFPEKFFGGQNLFRINKLTAKINGDIHIWGDLKIIFGKTDVNISHSDKICGKNFMPISPRPAKRSKGAQIM